MRRVVLVCLAAAVGLFAQGPGGRAGRMGFGGPQHTVTGAPYSAVEVTTSQQVLAGGNTIQSRRQATVYRDGQGRVRTENTMQRPGFRGSEAAGTVIAIHDPVAGVIRHVDAQNRVVTETPIRAAGAGHGAYAGRGHNARRPADPNVTTENLGQQTINGVAATGMRITRTIPAGAVGNAQPIQSVSEVWTSTDLKVPVLVKTSDPRFGTTITQLTNINRSEPDPALFQAPAGYTVRQRPAFRPVGRGPHGNQ